MKLQEDKISKELIDKYPDLQEYQLKGKERLKTQIKSIKGILEIITEEEDKGKFYEYINSYNSRKGKKPFKQISDKSANDEVDDDEVDNNKEEEEVDDNKEEEEEVDDDNKENKVKTKVKIKVKVKKKVKDDVKDEVKTDVKEEALEKMKKQRDNVLKNYHSLQEEYNILQENNDNLSELHKDYKKDYKEVCNERNKLQLAMEKKGWNKDLGKEFDKYTSFYQKYSGIVDELDKHKK